MKIGRINTTRGSKYNEDEKDFDDEEFILQLSHVQECPHKYACWCHDMYISDSVKLVFQLIGGIIVTLLNRLVYKLKKPFRR